MNAPDQDKLELPEVRLDQEGSYSVRVYNEFGSVQSDMVFLRVDQKAAILTHPERVRVEPGSSAVLEVAAEGEPAPAFQWFRDGTPLPEETGATLSVQPETLGDTAYYSVEVSNEYRSETSEDVLVRVVSPQQLLLQPQSQTVAPERDVTLAVAALWHPTPVYQWRFNGADIPGAVDSALELQDVEASDCGTYTVVVSNAFGSVESEPATVRLTAEHLRLQGLPQFTRHPAGTVAVSGSNVRFEAQTTGPVASTYQWFFNGAPIPGATDNKFEPKAVTTEHEGVYHVVASNPYGSSVSAEAGLVTRDVLFTRQPESVAVYSGESHKFQADGIAPGLITYQWRHNDQPIGNAILTSYELSGIKEKDQGVYTLDLITDFGVFASDEAVLTVPSIIITGQPQSRHLRRATKAVFEVSVDRHKDYAFAYQWFYNGAAIEEATARELELPGVSLAQSGAYHVHVWTNNDSATSHAATLTVIEPGSVVSQSGGGSFLPGTDIELSISPGGNPAPGIQWSLNGEAIPGATGPGIVLADAQPVDGGHYSVIVYNELGAEESDVIPVRVEAPLLPFSDDFASRGSIHGVHGTGSGSNVGASRESGEPKHAGKDGDHSVWLAWVAPESGLVTFSTVGSQFDTLLGVYVSDDEMLNHLVEVASDDDEGGYHTSQVQCVVVGGVEYIVAVDGFDHANGDLVLHWNLESSEDVLPSIGLGPQDTTLNLGSTLVISVDFQSAVPADVQWYFDGQPIAGADQSVFTLNGFDWQHVGVYSVWLSTGSIDLFAGSAEVQINTEGLSHVAARDKLADAALAGVLTNGPVQTQSSEGDDSTPSRQGRASFFNAVSGYSGTQIFSTLYAGKDPGEPNHCGIVGGASYWFIYQPPTSGWLELDTNGSTFDTLLAVYTDGGSGSGYDSLLSVACDNNSGTDHRDSALVAEVEGGRLYFIVVDGVYGARGTVRLNYLLNTQPVGNHAPVASGDLVSRAPNQTLNIYVPNLLENDYDLDGDTLSLIGTTTYTINGGYVSWQLGSSYITYYPSYYSDAEDTFEYTISDGKGGTSSTAVTVTVGSGGGGEY